MIACPISVVHQQAFGPYVLCRPSRFFLSTHLTRRGRERRESRELLLNAALLFRHEGRKLLLLLLHHEAQRLLAALHLSSRSKLG